MKTEGIMMSTSLKLVSVSELYRALQALGVKAKGREGRLADIQYEWQRSRGCPGIRHAWRGFVVYSET